MCTFLTQRRRRCMSLSSKGKRWNSATRHSARSRRRGVWKIRGPAETYVYSAGGIFPCIVGTVLLVVGSMSHRALHRRQQRDLSERIQHATDRSCTSFGSRFSIWRACHRSSSACWTWLFVISVHGASMIRRASFPLGLAVLNFPVGTSPARAGSRSPSWRCPWSSPRARSR